MIKRFGAWLAGRGKPDLHGFFQSLTAVRPGQGGYTHLDRYRDFREVFGTPVGRKVLHQLVDHCEGSPSLELDAEQTHKTAFRNGRRSVGLWIVHTMNAEPMDKAPKGQSEEKK